MRYALRAAAFDMDATHHFVFGAACSVFDITLGSVGLGAGWSAGLADDAFQRARRGCYEVRYTLSEVCSVRDCTNAVPREHDYGLGNSNARKGLM